jgi:monoamine oxidase
MPHAIAPEGRIHFAGEHTSPWQAWMEGAIESAERAALEVNSAVS